MRVHMFGNSDFVVNLLVSRHYQVLTKGPFTYDLPCV
jgi:hypothetical protein